MQATGPASAKFFLTVELVEFGKKFATVDVVLAFDQFLTDCQNSQKSNGLLLSLGGADILHDQGHIRLNIDQNQSDRRGSLVPHAG